MLKAARETLTVNQKIVTDLTQERDYWKSQQTYAEGDELI